MELFETLDHDGPQSIRASSAAGFLDECVSTFFTYLKTVMRFFLYQQHSVIRGESPQMNRSFVTACGECIRAPIKRWFPSITVNGSASLVPIKMTAFSPCSSASNRRLMARIFDTKAASS